MIVTLLIIAAVTFVAVRSRRRKAMAHPASPVSAKDAVLATDARRGPVTGAA